MILAFKIEAEVQRHLKKWLLAAKSTYWTVEYRDYRSNDQCQKCQTFKHLQNKCNKSSRCLYCERNHQIRNHKCQLSTCKDKQSCNHMISRCCNCQNVHFANSIMCKTYQTAQSISSQKDYLVTKWKWVLHLKCHKTTQMTKALQTRWIFEFYSTITQGQRKLCMHAWNLRKTRQILLYYKNHEWKTKI